jgi:hypothetical protein
LQICLLYWEVMILFWQISTGKKKEINVKRT